MKKFAMVFPGQGSQAVGMLADLANEYPVVTETFKQASEAKILVKEQTNPLKENIVTPTLSEEGIK